MLPRARLADLVAKAAPAWALSARSTRDTLLQGWQELIADQHRAERVKEFQQEQGLPFWEGSLGDLYTLQCAEPPYSVMAIDGSQIYSDHHEGTSWYLTTTGSCNLQYMPLNDPVKSSVKFKTTIQLGTDPDCSEQRVALDRTLHEYEVGLDDVLQNPDALLLYDGILLPDYEQIRRFGYEERWQRLAARLLAHKPLIAAYVSMPASARMHEVVMASRKLRGLFEPLPPFADSTFFGAYTSCGKANHDLACGGAAWDSGAADAIMGLYPWTW